MVASLSVSARSNYQSIDPTSSPVYKYAKESQCSQWVVCYAPVYKVYENWPQFALVDWSEKREVLIGNVQETMQQHQSNLHPQQEVNIT